MLQPWRVRRRIDAVPEHYGDDHVAILPGSILFLVPGFRIDAAARAADGVDRFFLTRRQVPRA
jgi:hypothetical protein